MSDSQFPIADFTNGKHHNRRWGNQATQEKDKDDFSIIDTTKQTSRFGRGRRRYAARRRADPSIEKKGGDMKSVERQAGKTRFNRRKQKIWNSRRYRRIEKKDRGVLEFSVKPETGWTLIEEYDLSTFSKLAVDDEPVVEDIENGFFGDLEYYDPAYDRVSVKKARSLQRLDKRMFFTVTTTDDEVIEELARLHVGNVFGTDAILSQLMACNRSVNAWDIIVRRVGKATFFDKREDSAVDFLTVNETAYNPPLQTEKEKNMRPDQLAVEATSINQNFTQQILLKGPDAPKLEFPNPHPFFDEDEETEGMEPAAVAYRYRKWTLPNGIVLVGRTELHGAVKKAGQNLKMTCFALNEYDRTSKNNWRSKLDDQRGAVLATALQVNSCKLAKWTTQTLLSGADTMNIGYVSRTSARDHKMHTILGTQFYKPAEFAKQINLNVRNVWGILVKLIEDCKKQPEGKYLLLKDPNKKNGLYLYKVSDDPLAE